MKNVTPRQQAFMSMILFLVGVGLLIAGFIVPPVGVIDPSVLVAFGEAMTWLGAIIGIDYKYRYKQDNKDESSNN